MRQFLRGGTRLARPGSGDALSRSTCTQRETDDPTDRHADPMPLNACQHPSTLFSLTVLVAALSACGGGSDAGSALASGASLPTGPGASQDRANDDEARSQATALAKTQSYPTFHMLPAELPAPDVDVDSASARQPPRSIVVPDALRALDTKRLTPDALDAAAGQMRARGQSVTTRGEVAPDATTMAAQVYTAAQIRQAYGLPALPAAGAQLTAAQQAALGAGQTIYVIDAQDDPNIAAELAAFDSYFGVPACPTVPVPATAALPLAKAGATCTFSKVFATSAGALTATAPAYDASWASEIALDVEWSHAIAPLARIVLVEAATSMNDALSGAIKLAGSIGPGVVSMSFGSGEGSWVTAQDALFTTSAMTYLASSGDNGAGVSWPAVSPGVLAVGGTSLSWSGSGTRSESAWSGSGGGISNIEALPAWQQGVVIAGGGALSRRAVSDVSFNADPSTGQYTAIIRKGQTAAQWYAYGGTSISAPQWGALLAISNAQRVLAGKAVLGDVHSLIYQGIASDAGRYASAFADITTGSDGSCATCAAGVGFDQATGWGTPNADQLLPMLLADGNVVPVNHAPTMPNASLAGVTGAAWQAQANGNDPDGDTLTYVMTGAPSGLTMSTGGALSWANPVKGAYTLRVTARDPGGLQAVGTLTLTIKLAPTAPVVTAATVSGVAGSALSVTMKGTDANGDVIAWSLANAASGMAINSKGVFSWPAPTAGQAHVTVVGTDPGGLSGSATLTINIDAPPTLDARTIIVAPGAVVNVALQGHDADNDHLTYTATGLPKGAALSSAGTLTWSKAVAGTYTLHVTVKDGRGGQVTSTITLAVHA